MPEFLPVSSFKPGELAAIIRRSYAALLEAEPRVWVAESAKWDDFDRQAFGRPDTVGRCVFVSCRGGGQSLLEDPDERGAPGGTVATPIGLASFDPRGAPEYGVVGQNCILPEYRGRGFGKRQILEVLRRFRARDIREARVTTSEHPFFIPALRMYASLGFREVQRYAGGPDPRFRLIALRLVLAD